MSASVHNVLFLCTGNSARSIFAESIVNHLGEGHFFGASAGSKPRGEIHPLTLKILQEAKLPTAGLRSKSWEEFAAPGAPHFNFIFTVCDDAAGELCPTWPGHPMTAHWGIADPTGVKGNEAQQLAAFRHAFLELDNRIRVFMSLPLKELDRMKLQHHLDEIGSPQSAASIP
jgi:protein-tyrosine-phosphatase